MERKIVITEDGYKFFRQEDGTYTDDPDPERADLVFENLAAIENEGLVPIALEDLEIKVYEGLEGWIAVWAKDEDVVVAGPCNSRRALGGELSALSARSIND